MTTEARQPATIWQLLLSECESAFPAHAQAVAQVYLVLGALGPDDLTLGSARITQGECHSTIPYSRITLQLIPVPLAGHVKFEVRDTGGPPPFIGIDLRTKELLVWCAPQLMRVAISEAQIVQLLREGEKDGRDPMPRVHFSGNAEEWGLCDQLLKAS